MIDLSKRLPRAVGENAFIKLMRATETLTARLQEGLAPRGLTLGQLGVLEALLHLGPMHQRGLGRKVLRSPANVTAVLDNLEARDLIRRRREGADRRFITVELTREGRRLIADAFPGHAARIAAAFAVLTPAEQEELGRLCRKLGLALAAAGDARRAPE